MAKIFDWDARRGTLTDNVGGLIGNNINGVLQKNDKGLSWLGNGSSSLLFTSVRTQLTGNRSLVVWFKTGHDIVRSADYLGQVIAADWGISSGIGIEINGLGKLSVGYGNGSYQWFGYDSVLSRNTWYCVIVTAPTESIFINGNNVTVSEIATLSASAALDIGFYASSRYFKGYISRVEFFNHALSEQEKASIYKDFLNSYPMLPEKYPQQALMSKPMDLSREKDNTYTNIIPEAASLFNTDGTGWWSVGSGTKSWNSNGYMSLISTGAQAFLYALAVGIIGKTYRITLRVKSDTYAGQIRAYIGTATYLMGVTVTSSWQTITENIYCDGTVLYIVASTAYTGAIDFDTIIVEDISGLVAAYNMIPVGNTLVDISGNGNNATIPAKVITTKNGLLTNGKTFAAPNSNTGIFTFMWRGIIHSSIGALQMVGRGSGDWYLNTELSNGVGFRVETAGGIRYAYSLAWAFAVNVPVTIIGTYDGANIALYINGVQSGTPTAQTGAVLDTGDLRFGGYSDTISLANCTHIEYREYNYVLSAQEIRDLYNSFVKPYFVEDFRSEGADGVAKVPTGWVKQAGSFRIGEIPDPVNYNIFSNSGSSGTTDWVDSNSDGLADNWGISGSTVASIITGNGFIGRAQRMDTTWTSRSLYHSTVMTANFLYEISFKYRSNGTLQVGNATAPFSFGANTGNPIYVSYATPCLVTASLRFTTINTGDWIEIDEVVVKPIVYFQDQKKGTKFLQCTTAGSLLIPSNQAYGTWEFDLYHTGNGLSVSFISINSLSKIYVLFAGSLSRLFLSKNISSWSDLLSTNQDYIVPNVWYRIKITRTSTGVFTIFIKGGANTPQAGNDGWRVVDALMSNPFTDNELTSSTAFGFSAGAGTCIANIKMLDGIIQ